MSVFLNNKIIDKFSYNIRNFKEDIKFNVYTYISLFPGQYMQSQDIFMCLFSMPESVEA